MKPTLLAICSALAVTAVAVPSTPEQIARSRAKRAANLAAKGGLVTKAPTGNFFRVVSAQDRVALENVKSAVKAVNSGLQVNVDVDSVALSGAPMDFARKLARSERTGGLLLVVDDATLPVLLSAPEEAWAILNVRTLDTDMPPREVYDKRIRKELCRGMACVFNAGMSINKPCVMDPVYSKADLDGLKIDIVVPESLSKMRDVAKKRGIGHAKVATYLAACEEGWAPAPTNDVQKAIWDKVHAMPTEPLKIKPETKKVAE